MEVLIPIVAIGGFWAFLIVSVSLHYAAKARKNGSGPLINLGGSGAVQGASEDRGTLLDELRRMEDRVRTLERILDADHPGWRSKL